VRFNISAAMISYAVFLSASVIGAEEYMRISNKSVFGTLTRGDVMFPHDRHFEKGIDCLRCHHRFEKRKNILTMDELPMDGLLPGTSAVSCAACHKPGRELEKAYHRMCITCHVNMNKKAIRSGPVMCGLCHTKKEN
jgi:hypothetical protein